MNSHNIILTPMWIFWDHGHHGHYRYSRGHGATTSPTLLHGRRHATMARSTVAVLIQDEAMTVDGVTAHIQDLAMAKA